MIKFPGIGLEFYINKNLIDFGFLKITWYAVFIVTAFAIALLIFKKSNGKFNIKYDDILDLAIFVIPISIIGARLYYCVFNLEYYIKYPMKILDITTGGLAIYGGIIAGAITCLIFCKKRKINLLDVLDFIVPAIALGQAIGRWGNFINIEAYGTETSLPWRMGIIENGLYKEVHPTFLYEFIVTLVLFIVLIILQKNRKFKGEITYVYLIGYSFARFFIEGLRIDSLMLFNVRVSQILSAIIFVIFCSILIYNVEKNKKSSKGVTK